MITGHETTDNGEVWALLAGWARWHPRNLQIAFIAIPQDGQTGIAHRDSALRPNGARPYRVPLNGRQDILLKSDRSVETLLAMGAHPAFIVCCLTIHPLIHQLVLLALREKIVFSGGPDTGRCTSAAVRGYISCSAPLGRKVAVIPAARLWISTAQVVLAR